MPSSLSSPATVLHLFHLNAVRLLFRYPSWTLSNTYTPAGGNGHHSRVVYFKVPPKRAYLLLVLHPAKLSRTVLSISYLPMYISTCLRSADLFNFLKRVLCFVVVDVRPRRSCRGVKSIILSNRSTNARASICRGCLPFTNRISLLTGSISWLSGEEEAESGDNSMSS